MSAARNPSRLARAALAVVALAAVVAAGGVGVRGVRPTPAGLLRAVQATAREASDGVPEILLRANGGDWEPNVVHARAGRPLRIRVARAGRHGCGSMLLVPDLGIALEVPEAGEASATLPPSRGEFLFTCGARMVKGVFLFE
jgi:plastocyanin domain-containing protein